MAKRKYKVSYHFTAVRTFWMEADDDTTARHDAEAAAQEDIVNTRPETGGAWFRLVDVISEVDEDSIVKIMREDGKDVLWCHSANRDIDAEVGE